MRTLFAVLFFSAARLAYAAPAPIDNGVEVAPGEYDPVVKLTIEGAYMCTGTLIGPNTILTAAHCLDKSDPDEPNVAVSFPDGDQTRALSLLVHPKWNARKIEALNSTVESYSDWAGLDDARRKTARDAAIQRAAWEQDDIGLVRIPSDSRRTIPIRTQAEASTLVGAQVTLVGYGRNDHTALIFDGAGTQRKGANRVAAAWRGLLFHVGEVRDRDYRWGGLVTRPDGKDVGVDHGDSGGPMLAGGCVIGVNAAGIDAPAEFETMREELGTKGDELYRLTRAGKLGWNVSVSLSSPESAELFALAKAKGLLFDVVDDVQPPAARTASSPLAPESRALEALNGNSALIW